MYSVIPNPEMGGGGGGGGGEGGANENSQDIPKRMHPHIPTVHFSDLSNTHPTTSVLS